MDCSQPGSFVNGIFQARILSELPFPTPEDLPNPGIELTSLVSPALTRGFLSTGATWNPLKYHQINFLSLAQQFCINSN